jgi:hypothetical protein
MSEAGRPCSVCSHPERREIELQIVAGATLQAVSTEFGMSPNSVMRHRDNHMTGIAEAEADRAAQRGEQGEDLVKIARGLRNKAFSLGMAAEQKGDLRTALTGVRDAGRLLETQGKLEGKIEPGTTVNIMFSQQFLVVQGIILQALAPYPEARLAVVKALADAEEAA